MHYCDQKCYLYFIAIEYEDFVPLSHDIIFNSNTTQHIYIPLLNDDVLEYNEIFYVNVSTLLDCVNTANGSVSITIEDDDCKYCNNKLNSYNCSIMLSYLLQLIIQF